MESDAVAARGLDPHRAWWMRALLVLGKPQPVFAAMRDDSDETAVARQEPILAVLLLAGAGSLLATPVARDILDRGGMDALSLAVWAFIGGGLYGTISYWVGGALLGLVAQQFGSRGSLRRARHVLAFACVPLALALVLVWPLRLALYGGDVFHAGGADTGAAGTRVLDVLHLALAGWAGVLLLAGVRAVHGWTWVRAAATVAVAAALPVGIVLLTTLRDQPFG